jgi:hypothetical protein
MPVDAGRAAALATSPAPSPARNTALDDLPDVMSRGCRHQHANFRGTYRLPRLPIHQ